ncbi:MAG: DEAD/DEAH box helicase [Candidatus Marsarchaeota archaeon]|nr:DEAD/DEAH box helicase [Candidatus Marsarchaeota archaeon]
MELKTELVEALKKIGFVTATETQALSIPVGLKGNDVIVRAKTGTGKTGAFLIPIMQMMQHEHSIRALVIVPTRELAIQVSSVSAKLGSHMNIRTVTVYGGASINVQTDLIRKGANIVVGTPGRIIDLAERGVLNLDNIKFLVLDEADTMFDMGFIEDIDYIISKLPYERQTMLFSATMPRAILDIARHHMKEDYKKIEVGKEEEITVTTINHNYFIAQGRAKFSALLAYIEEYKPKKAIIFARTQHGSELIYRVLKSNGVDAILLHGGLTQAKRERSLFSFKSGVQFMIATNVASRGLDIADVTDVINFDAPETPYVYVHRVGRSARMGKEGRAFTLVSNDEKGLIRQIEFDAGIELKNIRLSLDKYKDIELPAHHQHERRFGGPRQFDNRHGQHHGQHGQHGQHGPHGGGNRGPRRQHRGYSGDFRRNRENR